ncbi:MAG: hypothetical protein KDC26_06370 [Armatimonadetes bacterium]|nr:hypothetical protein [Armatimonadota bacterium]
MKTSTLFISLIALSFAIVGCGKSGGATAVEDGTSKPSQEASESAVIPDGMNLATARDKSFTIELPEDWLVCDAEDDNYKTKIEELKTAKAAVVLNAESIAAASAANFGAVDISDSTMEDNFAANVNANTQSIPAGKFSDDQIKQGAEAATEALFKDKGEPVEIVKIGGHSAGRYAGVMDMGAVKSYIIGYSVPVGEKIHTFTFACGSEEADKYKSVFDKMAKSIKIN